MARDCRRRAALALAFAAHEYRCVMGTTGVAMPMIRPFLRANDNRRHNVHGVVFFIFLVANAGGLLTLLFPGFLNGVGFFWTAKHLAVFHALDSGYFSRAGEVRAAALDPTPDTATFSARAFRETSPSAPPRATMADND